MNADITFTTSDRLSISDLEGCLSYCRDSFSQLAALLLSIKEKAPKGSDAGKLAALGRLVAGDMADFADAALTQVQKGGVTQ
ncbi:MAG: hypothetical protein J0L85_21150 [Zoogloea sp.]|nr:hypothetical protein [Zoogloea sp.]MCA0185094.1 hypothetical protein [Pseudomonadota bacterium]